MTKYRDSKDWRYLAAGAMWIGICSGWFSASINFILLLFTDIRLPIELYLLINFPLYPIFVMIWTVFITDLFFKNKENDVAVRSSRVLSLFILYIYWKSLIIQYFFDKNYNYFFSLLNSIPRASPSSSKFRSHSAAPRSPSRNAALFCA